MYAKYIDEFTIELPPTNYNGVSNYCHCEEKLLADGYLPLIVEEEPTADKYVKKYRLESDAIYQYTVEDTSDCNKYTEEGEYYLGVGLHGNCPFGVACQFALIVSVYNGVIVQEAIGLDEKQKRYKRSCVNGVWGEWAELASGGDVVTISAISKGQNGYMKFSNGIIIQWGITTASTSGKTITLPIPFSSNSSYVVIVSRDSDQANADVACARNGSSTIVVYTNRTEEVSVSWMAIGY